MKLSRRLLLEDDFHPLYSKLQEQIKLGNEVNDLTVSNPTLAGLVYPNEMFEWKEKMKFYLPDSQGILSAREAIAEYYNGQFSPENIVLTSGTSEGYSWLMKLLCNPGDEILIPSPSYPLFATIADLECVKVRFYFLRYKIDSWQIDMDSIRENITERTKMIVLINPNNPTGMLLNKQAIDEILTSANKWEIPLVVDEVFSDYIHHGKYNRIRSNNTLVFTLNGISKSIGLPQMKLSWIIVDGNKADVEKIKHFLAIISDTFLSVSHIIQYSLPELFNFKDEIQKQILCRLTANLDFLKNKNDNRIFLPDGGWYALVDKKIDEDKFVLDLLEKEKVYAYPGSMFGFNESGFIITSLLCDENSYRQGIEKLLTTTF